MLILANFIAIFLILGSHAAVAHGDHWHHHGRGDHHDHNHGARDQIGYLRRLDNVGSHMNMPRHPDFVVGGKAYGSHDEFFQMGGKCRTQPRTPEEEDRANNDFKAWKEAKEKRLDKGFDAELGGRRLGVDWNTQTITVPVHFHVIHAGDAGRQYTYESDPSYIERSIKALNYGFRGVVGEFPPYPDRSYERYTTTDADSNIRFCLAGTTTTDNADWYYADPWNANLTTMKEALHIGGSETMNVYVSSLGGAALGMATKPPNDSKRDGVVILNEVMPGGPLGTLSEGDTLTHEVGHWLGLMHTHDNPNGPCSGEGDYFMSFEASPSFGCDVTKDECQNDGGKNPIHDFMSYSDDDCMDQFTPGQNLRMQQAWETYRHKSGHSEAYSLAEDGVSCIYVPPPTSSPTTSDPTSSPTTLKPTTSTPTTSKPTTSTPTTSKPTTSKPTKLTGKIASTSTTTTSKPTTTSTPTTSKPTTTSIISTSTPTTTPTTSKPTTTSTPTTSTPTTTPTTSKPTTTSTTTTSKPTTTSTPTTSKPTTTSTTSPSSRKPTATCGQASQPCSAPGYTSCCTGLSCVTKGQNSKCV